MPKLNVLLEAMLKFAKELVSDVRENPLGGVFVFALIVILVLALATIARAAQLTPQGCMVYAAWSADIVWAREVGADKEKVRASVKAEAEEAAPLLLRQFDVLWATGMPRGAVAQAVFNECNARRGQYGDEV
jgi:hypothetical protein